MKRLYFKETQKFKQFWLWILLSALAVICRKGKAYNVSGNMGMQFILKNGKKFLIGTKKPEEFQKAMDKMMKK